MFAQRTHYSVFTTQFTICRPNYLPGSYNLFLNILRWEGWNFNRQLLLRLCSHEKRPCLQNPPALPCVGVCVSVCVWMKVYASTRSVYSIWTCFYCTVQTCHKELYIPFVKSRWLCDLVFPAVIRALSMSHLIAQCQSGKEEHQLVNLHTSHKNKQREAVKEKMTEL